MSSPTASTRAPEPMDPAAPAEPAEPGTGRGVTTITDRVVEKIAAAAAAEVDLASGAPRQLLGMRLGRTDPPTRVEVRVTGDVVRVRIAVSVRWPAPIRPVTREVRAHVTERLRALTGLRVGWVDIDVPTLPTGPSG